MIRFASPSHRVAPMAPTGRLSRHVPLAACLLVAAVLCLPVDAHAASVFNGFPLVDDVLCGFFAYSRTKLAPMIAGIVLIFSVVGHWLGSGKMWSTMLYVGLGLGIVLGAGSALASYTGVAASCIAS
jgi:type IV secretory pathway VirB2 component (pilin)